MIYTRHFYRIDEVCAALEYEIQRKRVIESLFWVQELIDSEEIETIKETLFKAWFHNIGLANIHILNDIVSITEKSDILTIVNTMNYCKRDCTLPIMFLYGISSNTYKNTNVAFTLPEDLIVHDKKLETFIRACCLGKYLDAWILSNIILKEDFDKYIIRIIKYKHNDVAPLDSENIYMKCALVGIACLSSGTTNKIELKEINEDYKKQIKLWNGLLGKRKRRIYQIPKDCLYGRTYRGTLTHQKSNINELYDTQQLLEGQQIYEEFIHIYDSFKDFKQKDKDYESFMDWYFPDDIPDEWSLEDQKKSHGYGVNQENDTPLMRRYFNRWVDLKNPCKIWDKEMVLVKCYNKIKLESYYIEKELLELYKKKVCITTTFDFNNMRKILFTLE